MNILITGSTGFIGKHLIKRLKEEGHNIYSIVRPSANLDFLKKEKIPYFIFDNNIQKLISFMQKNKIIGVVHLASLFLTEHKTEDIDDLIKSNILLGTTILEACDRSSVDWFVNTGTFWQHYKNKIYSPVNLYAATKQAFESIAQYYIENTNINFITIQISDTFGPNDTRNKIFNIWGKISKTGEILEMSPGQQIIDINYIDNVVDGFYHTIKLLSKDKKRKLSGKVFSLYSKERMSLRKLANLFEKTTLKKLNIKWGTKAYRPREIMIPWNKGISIPSWKPKISLKQGIIETIKSHE